MVVRVPASTSNLSHGFDCMGMAVAMYNTVVVSPRDDDRVHADHASDDGLARLGQRVREHCADAWGQPVSGFTVSVTGEIPMSRGLGSSASVLLGLCAALQALAKRPTDIAEVITLATQLEGHPDNTVAAGCGGFTVAGSDRSGQLCWHQLAPPSDCEAVLVIPDQQQSTASARGVLPDVLDRADAVTGWQRSSLITAAIAADMPQRLTPLLGDGWHEHYRAASNPGLAEAMQAARQAGAYGCWLSGSGSTVMALANHQHAEAIAAAMSASYEQLSIPFTIHRRALDRDGLQVLERC